MINTTRLRCTLGWLAMFLPWIVAILLWIIPSSISATYYRFESGPVFMIILGAASFLLIAYKGYDTQDDIINTLAGVFGLMICLFPCQIEYGDSLFTKDFINSLGGIVGTFSIPMNISLIVHNASAVIFFGLLSYNSLFLFTKHGSEMTKNKKIRNIIFRVCGIGMILSFTIFLLPYFYIQTWLIETIALFFFGVSWLTKADYYPWLFADKKN